MRSYSLLFGLAPVMVFSMMAAYPMGAAAALAPYDGHSTVNQSGDAVQYVQDAGFDQYRYSNADLDALKASAKESGSYYQGTVSFNASNQMPDGVIFVDTVSGLNIDTNGAGTTASSDFAAVDIQGNAPASADGIFHGVLIVAGALSISGNFQMYGLVYAVNGFTYTGTETGRILGTAVSPRHDFPRPR